MNLSFHLPKQKSGVSLAVIVIGSLQIIGLVLFAAGCIRGVGEGHPVSWGLIIAGVVIAGIGSGAEMLTSRSFARMLKLF